MFPHSIKAAARKPRTAQMMTFWKNVARMRGCLEQKQCRNRLPKAPLPGSHDPEPEEEIGHGMSNHAGDKASGPVSHEVVEGAGHDRRYPIGPGMGKSEG